MRKPRLTELLVYYGHVRNSLVTIIISFTIKFFRAHINCSCFRRLISTNLWIDLQSRTTIIVESRQAWTLTLDSNHSKQSFYLDHHFSKLPNCNLIVWITHIKDVAIGSGRIFLSTNMSCNLQWTEHNNNKFQRNTISQNLQSSIRQLQ
jgi:hypothetical protein